tara:strand:+ start:332 stop:625 length:294 start_codon:yes stop_codon:yes gene_type:complete
MEPRKVIGKWDYAPELIPKHTYTEARGRATAKWQANNREYYNAYQRELHAHRMRTDWDYRVMREKAWKRSNAKRKIKMAEDKALLKEFLKAELDKKG